MSSRRKPWPFDLIVSGTGLMLVRDKNNAPVFQAVKAQPLSDQPAPGDIAQEDVPLVVEAPHAWSDLSLGYGLSVDTPDQQGHKYSYALGVDCSLGGYIMKGPLITTCTPTTRDTTNGITDFVELPNQVLLAFNGRYVQKRASDNITTGWAVSKDFGAGVNCIGVTIHQSDGGAPANPTVYAAMNSTNVAQYCSDNLGVTWTAFATHVSLTYFTVSRELWRCSDTNQVSKCDEASNPTVEASWSNSNSFRIGDKQYPINSVHVSSIGFPVFFKTDGIYVLDSSGQDSRLYPWFKFGSSADDGHFAWDFGNDTHVTYGYQHVKLTPSNSLGAPHLILIPTGPERSLSNTSPVHGRLTAGCGDGAMFAYVGLYNPDIDTSYLLKYSSYIGTELQPGKLEEAQRIDAWHGSISQAFEGKKITAMHRSRVGAPPGHYRMYLGFSDGTISWFNLPCTPNPILCAAAGSYLFDNLVDGVLTMPQFHGGHMANPKSLRGFSVAGTQLTDTEYVQWQYKLSTLASSYTTFVDATGTATIFDTTPEKRADFQNGASSYLLDLQLIMHNTFTNLSPVVTTPTIHYAIVTPVALRYKGVIDASGGIIKLDGRPMRIGTESIRTLVKNAAGSNSGITITLPDGTTRVFSFINYGESLSWTDRINPWGETIGFEIVEYHPNQNFGDATHVLGLIANLAPYTIGDLTNYTIQDLDSL